MARDGNQGLSVWLVSLLSLLVLRVSGLVSFVQDLTVKPRLAWGSRSFCLGFLNAGIEDMCYQLVWYFFLLDVKNKCVQKGEKPTIKKN